MRCRRLPPGSGPLRSRESRCDEHAVLSCVLVIPGEAIPPGKAVASRHGLIWLHQSVLATTSAGAQLARPLFWRRNSQSLRVG